MDNNNQPTDKQKIITLVNNFKQQNSRNIRYIQSIKKILDNYTDGKTVLSINISDVKQYPVFNPISESNKDYRSRVTYYTVKEGKCNRCLKGTYEENIKDLLNTIIDDLDDNKIKTFLFASATTNRQQNMLQFIFSLNINLGEIYNKILDKIDNITDTILHYRQENARFDSVNCLSTWCISNDSIPKKIKIRCLNLDLDCFKYNMKELLLFDFKLIKEQEDAKEKWKRKDNNKFMIYTLINTFEKCLNPNIVNLSFANKLGFIRTNGDIFDNKYLGRLNLRETYKVKKNDPASYIIYVLKYYMICFMKLRCAKYKDSDIVGLQQFGIDAFNEYNNELAKIINQE